jgi:phosphoribosyl-ATP pyrophosphohydrolase/phosphoribosyl-AMP cyclohydrolase
MSIDMDTERLKWDASGLIAAVLQDYHSKEVLMLGYMNRESLKKTLDSGEVWFWSRSRQELWHKGDTSGNVQKVVDIQLDCDRDTLLVRVEPAGPVCHTGKYSCYFESVYSRAEKGESTKDAETSTYSPSDRFAILNELESLIAERELERPEGSYTTYLFDKGVDKILKKVGEEASEVIIAAKNNDADELRYESSDLIFHLLVLLRERKLPLDEVLRELAGRHKK